jgi:hypothetical protein
VLVRSSVVGRLIERALARAGIPAVTGGTASVMKSGLALDIRSLLEAMEPPLLKWEKEKQKQRRSGQQRDKKNSRGAHHGASLGGAGAKAGTREAGAPYDSDSVDQGLPAPWGDGFVHDVLRASGLTPPALDLLSPPKRPRLPSRPPRIVSRTRSVVRRTMASAMAPAPWATLSAPPPTSTADTLFNGLP